MFAGGRVRRVRVKTVLDVGREHDDREWNLLLGDQERSPAPGQSRRAHIESPGARRADLPTRDWRDAALQGRVAAYRTVSWGGGEILAM